jgi:hypothetical protein
VYDIHREGARRPWSAFATGDRLPRVLTRSQRIRVVHRRFDPHDNEGSFAMTTPDLKAIEERLNDPFAPVLDGAVEDDIRALLGMVWELQCGADCSAVEAAESKLAEVSGQLALIQSVRVAEEEQLAEVTRERDEAREVVACIADDLNLEHVDAYDENHGLPWYVRMIVEARNDELKQCEDTFRQIIASASSRLVWAVDGRGSPEQAVRAVEALGEAYGASQTSLSKALSLLRGEINVTELDEALARYHRAQKAKVSDGQ